MKKEHHWIATATFLFQISKCMIWGICLFLNYAAFVATITPKPTIYQKCPEGIPITMAWRFEATRNLNIKPIVAAQTQPKEQTSKQNICSFPQNSNACCSCGSMDLLLKFKCKKSVVRISLCRFRFKDKNTFLENEMPSLWKSMTERREFGQGSSHMETEIQTTWQFYDTDT